MDTHYQGVERRHQEDRRGNYRGGKRDRRQNTCGKCRYFELKNAPEQGWCQKHLKPFLVSDFSCVLFQAQETTAL